MTLYQLAFTNVVVQVVMNMGLSDKITVVGYDMGELCRKRLCRLWDCRRSKRFDFQ